MDYRPSSTLSKKQSNSRPFAGNPMYDGVFPSAHLGVPNTPPLVDDYAEIFGGCGGSSIPALDVPELKDRRVPVDVRSSKLDYSKIFGGFVELDFVQSYEDLFDVKNKTEKKTKTKDFAMEEGRTMIDNRSTSEGTVSNRSVETIVSSRVELQQSFSGVKQFDTLYHKTDCSVEKNVSSHEEPHQSLPDVKQFDTAYHKTNCSVEANVSSHEEPHQSLPSVKQFGMPYQKANSVETNVSSHEEPHQSLLRVKQFITAYPKTNCSVETNISSNGEPHELLPGVKQFGTVYHKKNCSVETNVFSHEESDQSHSSIKQFDTGHHEMIRGVKNGTNGVTQVEEVPDVPGYTCSVDEVKSAQVVEPEQPTKPVENNDRQNFNSGEGVMEGKDHRKPLPALSPGNTDKQTSPASVNLKNKSKSSRSFSYDMSFNSYDFVFKMHPSEVPAFKATEQNASDGTAGICSPFSSDEETDPNSVSATSAAAVRKAIEKAQVRMKIARESMERRKGLQRNEKLNFKKRSSNKGRDRKIEDEAVRCKESLRAEVNTPIQLIVDDKCKESKNEGEPDRCKEESLETCAEVKTPRQVFADDQIREGNLGNEPARCKEESLNTRAEMNTRIQVFAGIAKKTFMKVGQFIPSFRSEKPEQEFKSILPNQIKDETMLKQVQQQEVPGQKEELEQEAKQLYADSETGKHNSLTLECNQADVKNMMSSLHQCVQNDTTTVEKTFDKSVENDKSVEVVEEIHEKESEKDLNAVKVAKEPEEHTNRLKPSYKVHNQEENGYKSDSSQEHEVTESKASSDKGNFGVTYCQQESIESQKKVEAQDVEERTNVKKSNVAQQNVSHQQEENEEPSKSKMIFEREEMEELVTQMCAQEEPKDRHDRAACQWVEYERKSEEGNNCDEYQKDIKDVEREAATAENVEIVHGRAIVKRNNGVHDREEVESELMEDGEFEGDDMLAERKNDKLTEVVYQLKENEKRLEETSEWTEMEGIQTEVDERVDNKMYMQVSQDDLTYQDRKSEEADDEYQHYENENFNEIEKACKQKDTSDEKATHYVPPSEKSETLESRGYEIGSKAVEVEHDKDEEEIHQTHFQALSVVESNKCIEQVMSSTEALASNESGATLGKTEAVIRDEQHNQQEEQWTSVGKLGKVGLVHEFGENYKDDPQGAIDQEEDNDSSLSSNEERWVNEEYVEDKLHSTSESEEKTTKMVHEMGTTQIADTVEENNCETKKEENEIEDKLHSTSESEEKTTKMVHEMGTTQIADTVEENNCETKREENEIEDPVPRKMEFAKEHFQKQDEDEESEKEKERLREREKEKVRERKKENERVVVERAIREARERALAEARERAERAALERATVEARERLKAETHERSRKASAATAGNASMEAKLKLERAAVERATAEARERALEKAMSGKATFDARKQGGSFAADKSGPSRDNGMRQNFPSSDPQNKTSGPSSSSSYSNSASRDVPIDNGANNESSQRHRARWERHQRTEERAAKALAEKNTRDFLLQKEQAERNRLAESLDADVKRWSGGKEGNLRALLSTLQYILGPDSGWQAVPLTDIVTAAAVKKAYRKAALCVHPDKLQQRGASIQQKYTCEKVFDLLQEALNKFSAQER